MGMDSLIAMTLTLVSALESSGGRNVRHELIRAPASIHYGTAALGEFGMMPKTLRLMHTDNPSVGATRYAEAALKRSGGCPITAAVILWEQGLNARSEAPATWRRGNARARLSKALAIWKQRAFKPSLEGCFLIGHRYSGPYEFRRTPTITSPTKTIVAPTRSVRIDTYASEAWRSYRRGI